MTRVKQTPTDPAGEKADEHRLKSIELNGQPELIATTFVGGLKHLPISYELS